MVPPIPELTSGRKVKGNETRCHTMKEIGTSLMNGQKKLMHNASYNPHERMRGSYLCGGASRLGLHGHWVAAQVICPPNPVALLPSLSLFPFLMFLHNHTTHTQTDPTNVPSLRMRAEGNYTLTCLHVLLVLYVLGNTCSNSSSNTLSCIWPTLTHVHCTCVYCPP